MDIIREDQNLSLFRVPKIGSGVGRKRANENRTLKRELRVCLYFDRYSVETRSAASVIFLDFDVSDSPAIEPKRCVVLQTLRGSC